MRHRLSAILVCVCLAALRGAVQRTLHLELDHAPDAETTATACPHRCEAAPEHPPAPPPAHKPDADCATCIVMALTTGSPPDPRAVPVAWLEPPEVTVLNVAVATLVAVQPAPRCTRGPPVLDSHVA